MVVRKFPRFPLTLPSTLVQRDKLRYKASVKDLSLKGCRLESTIRPFTGMMVELLLELPGEATPIHISNATVRWTGSQGLGVEFLIVAPADEERLKRVVEQLSVQAGQALIFPKAAN
ncbi:MAG: PilZ domain-containing protein [Nitrospira sp.]|jgi:c-di-GMP-binding flagellar brake protein YcgR|nr:PilZ domain-containing protein [Nitrospira sp. BO4]